MPKTEVKNPKPDRLKEYIERLRDWPEDDPPSARRLGELRREFRLSEHERDRLALLVENHMRRAEAALTAGDMDQAAAEFARVAQLRPENARIRVELAGVYLQRSLIRGYGRPDRRRAVRLARKALELHPGSPEARSFLQEYRRMNTDFRNVRNRRYALPFIALILIGIGMLWWGRERIFSLFRAPVQLVRNQTEENAFGTLSESREIEVNTAALESRGIPLEIVSAKLGRRNDGSYLHILGRLESPERPLGAVDLIVQGRNPEDLAVFALPWALRSEDDPVLIPGDTQPMAAFRWLSESEEEVRELEIAALRLQEIPNGAPPRIEAAEILWETARPEGAAITAWIRDRTVFEAYDRQVLIMDLAVENSGSAEISHLLMDISLGPRLPEKGYSAVSSDFPPMKRGERRVWGISMDFPLDADPGEQPVTLRITEAG